MKTVILDIRHNPHIDSWVMAYRLRKREYIALLHIFIQIKTLNLEINTEFKVIELRGKIRTLIENGCIAGDDTALYLTDKGVNILNEINHLILTKDEINLIEETYFSKSF